MPSLHTESRADTRMPIVDPRSQTRHAISEISEIHDKKDPRYIDPAWQRDPTDFYRVSRVLKAITANHPLGLTERRYSDWVNDGVFGEVVWAYGHRWVRRSRTLAVATGNSEYAERNDGRAG